VEAVAQRIVDSISTVFVIEEKEVFSGASIGLAEITSTYTSADDVLRDADAAMYQAKNLGRNRYVMFDISMRKQLIEEIDIERCFREAFKAGEFECSLQAIKNLADSSVLFHECSIHWPDLEKRGKKGEFWAIADKCGLTYEINKQLVGEAFRVLHTWRSAPEYKNTKIGLNLSVEHLLHESYFEDLVKQIESSEIYSERLVIELSELALTRFTNQLPSMLNKLQSLGVTLVLDKFGSYSGSLNHFFNYDFDFIKLTPDLVNTFGMSDKYYRLVKSIILIANEMSIGVIAAGVNDEMILQDLNEIGCHFGQGLAIGAPVKL
jgi:EAL domain-containing protein (putative c-di-GMP-specific phosphodiesterase class I)